MIKNLMCIGGVALALLLSHPQLLGQVVEHPNQIRGTIRFTNPPDSPVGRYLASPARGFTRGKVYASSLTTPRLDATTDVTPTNPTSTEFEITVEASAAGIPYNVSPEMHLEAGRNHYIFRTQTSAPVRIGLPAETLPDFAECAGLLEVRFVNSSGELTPVNGGRVEAISLPEYYTQARALNVPLGSTNEFLVVRGDTDFEVIVTCSLGTDYYSDLVTYRTNILVRVDCGEIRSVNCVVGDLAGLGRITGRVDMLGEYELPIINPLNSPNTLHTILRAEGGPLGNLRWHSVPGAFSGRESSGEFTLAGMIPSSASVPSKPYGVWSEMLFRSNRWFQGFRTPGIGVTVPATGETNLGDIFVMNPGYLRGRIELQGPICSTLLSNIAFPPDADGNGLPDTLAYSSLVYSIGVNRSLPGATYSAGGGAAAALFDGSFRPASGRFEGNYELVLAGLNGEASVWSRPELYLHFVRSEGAAQPGRFTASRIRIREDAPAPADFEIHPGQPSTNDLRYCFSEVRLRYRTTSGLFHSPGMRNASTGGFSGTIEGRAANYSVSIDDALGTPWDRGTASNEGLVVMNLPAGTYRFRPVVVSVNPGGGESVTDLPPLDYTVGCGQCVDIEPCLQVVLDGPSCFPTPSAVVTGSVLSCTNRVTKVQYQLDNDPPQLACTDCGINPRFTLEMNLGLECAERTLVVTAFAEDGGVSSVRTRVRFDGTPPVITCPPDRNVIASTPQVVHYTVTATDNCPSPMTLECQPPSGSVFPVGETLVKCQARDVCSNLSACSFRVNVCESALEIERAVIVRWSCGTLQGAPAVTGPYLDIPGATSPYCAPARGPHRFFRVRE